MRDEIDDAVRIADLRQRCQTDVIRAAQILRIRLWIHGPQIEAVVGERTVDICRPRVAHIGTVLLERHAHKIDTRRRQIHLRPHEPAHHSIGNIAAHTIIDAPSRLDQFGVKAEILCLIDKIVGIDADAVSAD